MRSRVCRAAPELPPPRAPPRGAEQKIKKLLAKQRKEDKEAGLVPEGEDDESSSDEEDEDFVDPDKDDRVDMLMRGRMCGRAAARAPASLPALGACGGHAVCLASGGHTRTEDRAPGCAG